MGLNYRDLRDALTEFDRIVFEGRTEGWDDNPDGERTALLAARRVLAQIDDYLSDRVEEIDAVFGNPPDDW